MNTRGLVELVALNIGYDLGVLSPEIFAMLVIMALITTLMTAPVLTLTEKLFRKEKIPYEEIIEKRKYNVLISFGNPAMGVTLLRLAHKLTGRMNDKAKITAMHLFSGNLFSTYKIDDYEKRNFTPVKSEANKLKLNIELVFKASENIDSDIIEEANSGKYDLLLVGIGHSIFEGSLLGRFLGYSKIIMKPRRIFEKLRKRQYSIYPSPFDDITREIMNRAKIPVGILINKNLQNIEKIMMPLFSINDNFLKGYASQITQNSDIQVTLFDFTGTPDQKPVDTSDGKEQYKIIIPDGKEAARGLPDRFDLIASSPEGIRKIHPIFNLKKENLPSLLIIRHSNERLRV